MMFPLSIAPKPRAEDLTRFQSAHGPEGAGRG